MGKPKKLYYVEVLPGGEPLGYREKGGGVYATKIYAVAQKEHLEARGSLVRLWETTTDWVESE